MPITEYICTTVLPTWVQVRFFKILKSFRFSYFNGENEEIIDFLTSKYPEIRINPENFHPCAYNGAYWQDLLTIICMTVMLFTLHQRTKFWFVQIESICRRQSKCDSKTEIWFGMGGKRRKC